MTSNTGSDGTVPRATHRIPSAAPFARREDPGATADLSIARTTEKDRFGEVHLLRDFLHGLAVHIVHVEHHGSRIAEERPVGERVHLKNILAAIPLHDLEPTRTLLSENSKG
jgi:hypothetical protein